MLAVLCSCSNELDQNLQTETNEDPIVNSNLTFEEIRTAANDIIVICFSSSELEPDQLDISNIQNWKINGISPLNIFKYGTQKNASNHYVYLETIPLIDGQDYLIETPYGNMEFTFDQTTIFCESIKTNQVAYSALSHARYAYLAIWLGTGGRRAIDGHLPSYQVIEMNTNISISEGTVTDLGEDDSSGDHVYKIDLSEVPEGGPYKIVLNGYGCSYPFGIGGEFSKKLAYTIFRAQYLQRCGCPILDPPVRMNPCHTSVYDVDGPIGEANIEVQGNEPTFSCYGGYHDAGDADRRAYHIANSSINLMIYEAFPELFEDGQYHIPGQFDENFNIKSYTNGIPDVIDEAEWGAMIWEYLQNEDGSIHFGTETKGYPEPFEAPLDLDNKKYGTVKTDMRATCAAAGLFMHLARLLKPYNPDRSTELEERAEKAMQYGKNAMTDPEKLYYYIQRYLLKEEEADHQKIKNLYTVAETKARAKFIMPPGYSLNDEYLDNLAYIMSYILVSDVPRDGSIVEFFKQVVHDAAEMSLNELSSRTYPIGNNPYEGGWGHNIRQTQYASAPILQWRLSNNQKYLDAASQLMDYKLGLNPLGISYVTGLGFNSVHNIHDRESAYAITQGMGPKPGITVFGPGVVASKNNPIRVVPDIDQLSTERQYVDSRGLIFFNEFTVFETMHYDVLYTVLSGGGIWDGSDPFEISPN